MYCCTTAMVLSPFSPSTEVPLTGVPFVAQVLKLWDDNGKGVLRARYVCLSEFSDQLLPRYFNRPEDLPGGRQAHHGHEELFRTCRTRRRRLLQPSPVMLQPLKAPLPWRPLRTSAPCSTRPPRRRRTGNSLVRSMSYSGLFAVRQLRASSGSTNTLGVRSPCCATLPLATHSA